MCHVSSCFMFCCWFSCAGRPTSKSSLSCIPSSRTTTTNNKKSTTRTKNNVSNKLHRPGIEPGASRIDLKRWQRLILPLNHRCL
ncbi:hypothetical protein DE146DRAFT_135049 [Phaeosphaeria sp. MPI-PUGE-AT-0046c]|nr:hypothetical protein DE146DRAFT_135049 [Phaeosphaeria sp. MPI-PUGE-AT-0046c]